LDGAGIQPVCLFLVAAESAPLMDPLSLEHAPKALTAFFDESLLQHSDFERLLIVRTESAL